MINASYIEACMKQTPIHEIHNDEVLGLIPKTSKK